MIAGLGAGQIAKMVAALVEGDNNILDKMIQKKIEDLGEQFLSKILAGPFNAGLSPERIAQAIRTGGASEITRLGQDFLKSGILPTRGYNPLRRRIHGQHGQLHQQAWARTDWAHSRDDWLGNRWKHDWRSQPRDISTGRWIPGRLETIAASLQYAGSRIGRRKKRARKIKRLARRRGKLAARSLMKELKGAR